MPGVIWPEPRLLTQEDASAYCGMAVATFRRLCPVEPLQISNRIYWDRWAIDDWIDDISRAQAEIT